MCFPSAMPAPYARRHDDSSSAQHLPLSVRPHERAWSVCQQLRKLLLGEPQAPAHLPISLHGTVPRAGIGGGLGRVLLGSFAAGMDGQ